METNTNDATRQAVILGLGAGGFPGKLTGALVGVLWPDSGDAVWGNIKSRVEALINQKIAEYEYRNISDDLDGLKGSLKYFHDRLADSIHHPEDIRSQYNTTKDDFVRYLPHFKSSPLLLLPLFAQFANLHLGFMREGVLNGPAWGWEPARWETEKKDLREAIEAYRKWALDTCNASRPAASSNRDEWGFRNRYDRQMTFDVLDHRHYWEWFDPANTTMVVHPTRTIYSDPLTGDVHDPIGPFPHEPVTYIRSLQAWGSTSLWGVRVGYDGGGAQQPPQSWRSGEAPISVATAVPYFHKVQGVVVVTADYVHKHGTWDESITRYGCVVLSPIIDNQRMPFFEAQPDDYTFQSGRTEFVLQYPGHLLSSINLIPGREGTLIFGFRLDVSY